MALMPTAAEIRLANLDRLVAEAGSLTAVAERADTNLVYLSQLRHRTPDHRTGKPREMGARMARRLERAFHKPEGWMDAPASLAMEPKRAYSAAPSPPPRPASDFTEPRVASDSEWQLLQDLRAMPAEDRVRLMRDIHAEAEKIRRHVRQYLDNLNHKGKAT